MALQHLPTYAETTAVTGTASSSTQEGAADPALTMTIDTRHRDVIEWNKKQTARESDSLFMSIIGLVFGGCVYLAGTVMGLSGLARMGLFPVVLALLEAAYVVWQTLAFSSEDGTEADRSHTSAIPSAVAAAISVSVPDYPLLSQYKQVLRSILPPHFLSDEELLRTPSGGSESITLYSPRRTRRRFFFGMLSSERSGRSNEYAPPASYDGALPHKVLRHNLEKQRAEMPPEEYRKLKAFVDSALAFHQSRDVIDIRNARHKGVLVHEAFHDIQGFLYDNYPGTIDALLAAAQDNRAAIEKWYSSPATRNYRGAEQYSLDNFFPTVDSGAINRAFVREAIEALNIGNPVWEMPSTAALKVVGYSAMDLGRNELVPVLLSAAAEGDTRAADILSLIFAAAGLNANFYATLPRF